MLERLNLSSILFRRPVSTATDAVTLISRLIVGVGFLQHGYAKVANGPEHFAASLNGLGVPAPEIMSWLTIGTELMCGSAMLIGVAVPLICIPMAVILTVAMVTVHLQFGFSSIKLQAVTPSGIKFGPPGYEVIVLYLGCLSNLVILGAGAFSIDSLLQRRRGEKK